LRSDRQERGSGDETIKRRLYESFGVLEYWVVDPELDIIGVYRRSGDSFGGLRNYRSKPAMC
jgi:Uma2 family endonuclease